MNIVLVGGTLEALLLSAELIKDHDVSIIEIEAEIGLPVHHPGRVIDRSLLDQYMDSEQQSFLKLKTNEQGWGCRWEWIVKHIAHHSARLGVEFFTRTQILEHRVVDGRIHLSLNTSERNLPQHLIADKVIEMNPLSRTGPGRHQHIWTPDSPQLYDHPPMSEWFGGVVSKSNVPSQEEPHANLILERSDGLVEFWWKTPSTWRPIGGFIEQCTTELPSEIESVSFDSALQRARSYAKKVLK